MSVEEPRRTQKNPREITATMDVYKRGASTQVTINRRIARETNFREAVEKLEPHGNPVCRQYTDPENPNRIVIELVEE